MTLQFYTNSNILTKFYESFSTESIEQLGKFHYWVEKIFLLENMQDGGNSHLEMFACSNYILRNKHMLKKVRQMFFNGAFMKTCIFRHMMLLRHMKRLSLLTSTIGISAFKIRRFL